MDAGEIEGLIARGALAQAAQALEDRGDLERAQALYEKVWDFARALAVARRRGDRPAALRLAIEANDLPLVAALLAEVAGGERGERARAAELLERKRRFPEAARLREGLGELDAARDLFRKGAQPLEAARLEEALGRAREAGAIYERFLADEPDAAEGPLAEAALGRILAGFGRHEEAARHLQRALRRLAALPADAEPGLADECGRQLVVELAALGFTDGARHLLDGLRATEPLDAFLARRARARSGGDGDAVLAGRYAVRSLLGSGGMGRVYFARDRLADRDVAVKVVAAPVDPRGREGWARFVREARAVAQLKHPHVVAVHEFIEAEGLLVMEYMVGGTLADRLCPPTGGAPGGMAPRRARRILEQLVEALAAAHGHGVIHRDVKPANVFFSATGEAKLGDFGVAHLQDLGATQTGGFIGTLAYMSPEQITGAPLTFACDVYALGVTAFQMLTGRLPFCGPDLVGQHLGAPPPAPSSLRPALGDAVDALVLRMLAKDPAERFGTLDDLSRALAALALPDEAATGAPAGSAETEAIEPPAEAAPRYRIEAEVERTPRSVVYRGRDDRLGRAVLIEQFAPGILDGDEGARHLAWLRAMARHGGPHLQRVLRVEREARTARAVYEAPLVAATTPGGRAEAGAIRALCAALAGPHAEGVAHGDVTRSIALEEAGPTLLVAGRAPTGATLADDVAALHTLAGGGRDTPATLGALAALLDGRRRPAG